MNRSQIIQVLSALAFCILGLLLILPESVWMPSMNAMTALALAVIAFGVFAIFVMKERARDEREESNRSFAGHVAFFAGAAVLLIAIIMQSVMHMLDSWLVGALIAMVVAKVGANLWTDLHR